MNGSYDIEVFYDGDCPLCLREIKMLRWFDKKRQRIRFTDIASPDFDPQAYQKSMEELMAEIHGRLPNGQWVVGVEVFRKLYTAIGFGPLVWPTRLPGIRNLADVAYSLFARNRLKLTGRCTDACQVDSHASES